MRPAILILILFVASACRAPSELPVYAVIDELALETSLGHELSAQGLEGTVHVADFIFTSCNAACPVMTTKMRQIYDEFADVEGVRFLSVTTDPERDTVEVLHEHARNLGVDESRWLFARAPMEEVVRLSEKEFLLSGTGFPAGHSQRFVLVDRKRRIRGYYESREAADLARLRSDLARLVSAR